jgi:hypothetical protein
MALKKLVAFAYDYPQYPSPTLGPKGEVLHAKIFAFLDSEKNLYVVVE